MSWSAWGAGSTRRSFSAEHGCRQWSQLAVPAGYLQKSNVGRAFAGRGVGALLRRWMVSCAARSGAEVVCGRVRTDNPTLFVYHIRQGWKHVGTATVNRAGVLIETAAHAPGPTCAPAANSSWSFNTWLSPTGPPRHLASQAMPTGRQVRRTRLGWGSARGSILPRDRRRHSYASHSPARSCWTRSPAAAPSPRTGADQNALRARRHLPDRPAAPDQVLKKRPRFQQGRSETLEQQRRW